MHPLLLRPPTCVVLDIEGTVAPISFVADVMFPYAKKHCRAFLEASFDTAETQEDIQAVREQVRWLATGFGLWGLGFRA